MSQYESVLYEDHRSHSFEVKPPCLAPVREAVLTRRLTEKQSVFKYPMRVKWEKITPNWYEEMMSPSRFAGKVRIGDFLKGLPKPLKPIEVDDHLAMRLDLKELQTGTFYKFDYNGREVIARVSKNGMLEVHELVEVQ